MRGPLKVRIVSATLRDGAHDAACRIALLEVALERPHDWDDEDRLRLRLRLRFADDTGIDCLVDRVIDLDPNRSAPTYGLVITPIRGLTDETKMSEVKKFLDIVLTARSEDRKWHADVTHVEFWRAHDPETAVALPNGSHMPLDLEIDDALDRAFGAENAA